MISEQKYINFECKVRNNLLHIIFDEKNSSVNTLSSIILEELDCILASIPMDSTIEGVVFESAKTHCFIAGADIKEIATITDEQDALAKASVGQDIINKISKLNIPTYSIINGACMGGGLELALACDVRIAIINPKTKLALPEVNLGFIPGFGGTQRLPNVVSLQNALNMILTGKSIDAKKAKKMKLVQEICYINQVKSTLSLIHKKIIDSNGKWLRKTQYKMTYFERMFSCLIFHLAKKSVMKITGGNYPAPLAAIKVIKKTFRGNIKKGLNTEAKAFSKLASSDISQNLVTLFFTNESLKKEYNSEVSDIESASIIGSGVMGGGIAFTFNKAKISVRMKDISYDAIALGFKQIRGYYQLMVKKRQISKKQADIHSTQITASTSFDGIQNSDIIIEAVVEDIDVKHKVLQEIETHIKNDCVIATNTSSLKVSNIAMPLARKHNVVGMHFFNPVNKMPLVEVVRTKYSSNDAVAKVMQLARRCGKVAVPVGDCNGFVVNRVLLPFMNEALFCLEESGKVQEIDEILKDFGMPMGAFELADEIGLDVCYKVAKILHHSYGGRMKPAITLDKMFTQLNLLGKKGGDGFYKNGKVSAHIDFNDRSIEKKEIIDRTLLIMINEAGRILEEGYIKNPHYLDMCMIMGAGFPAFRGGVLKYADSIGLDVINDKLHKFTKKHGERFTPCQLIQNLAKENTKFYQAFEL